MSPGVVLRQLIKQRFGVLQVSGVKPLGEPAVDRYQQLVGFCALALPLPQARQAGSGAEFPRPGLLLAGYRQGLLEAGSASGDGSSPASTPKASLGRISPLSRWSSAAWCCSPVRAL